MYIPSRHLVLYFLRFRLCLQFCVCLGRFAFRLQRCLTVSGIILSSLKAHTPPQLAILDNCKNNEQKQRPATTLLIETRSTTHAKKRFPYKHVSVTVLMCKICLVQCAPKALFFEAQPLKKKCSRGFSAKLFL